MQGHVGLSKAELKEEKILRDANRNYRQQRRAGKRERVERREKRRERKSREKAEIKTQYDS